MAYEPTPQLKLIDFYNRNTPYDIYTKLSSKLYGLDPELKQIAILIHTWAKRLSSKTPEPTAQTLHFMIAAPSGSGKTALARILSDIVPCPVHVVNASAVSKVGFTGTSYTDFVAFTDIIENDSCGIIILDELDKLLAPSYDGKGTNVNREAQEQMLTMLEGEAIALESGTIQTERILFIGTGAFDGIEEYQDSYEPEYMPSFGLKPKTTKERQPVQKSDIIKWGASKQLMGRFLTVLNFPEPSKDVLYQICRDTIYEVAKLLEVQLPMTQDFFDQILEEVEASEAVSGCRDIRSAIWEYTLLRYSDRLCEKPEPLSLPKHILNNLQSPNSNY